MLFKERRDMYVLECVVTCVTIYSYSMWFLFLYRARMSLDPCNIKHIVG